MSNKRLNVATSIHNRLHKFCADNNLSVCSTVNTALMKYMEDYKAAQDKLMPNDTALWSKEWDWNEI